MQIKDPQDTQIKLTSQLFDKLFLDNLLEDDKMESSDDPSDAETSDVPEEECMHENEARRLSINEEITNGHVKRNTMLNIGEIMEELREVSDESDSNLKTITDDREYKTNPIAPSPVRKHKKIQSRYHSKQQSVQSITESDEENYKVEETLEDASCSPKGDHNHDGRRRFSVIQSFRISEVGLPIEKNFP